MTKWEWELRRVTWKYLEIDFFFDGAGWSLRGCDADGMTHFEMGTLNNIATFEVSLFKLKCLTKQEAVNHIRCWDEWTPANELWRDPVGSFELASGLFLVCQGRVCGAVVTLWYGHQALPPPLLSANVSVSKWDWHRPETYPAGVLWNQRPLKWTSACVQSAPRNLLGSKASKCGLLHEDILDTAWSVGYVPAPDALALHTPPPPPPPPR